MIVGFTGTREGLTHSQLYSLRRYLIETAPTELHHGCCVGADASVHKIIRSGALPIKIVGHPGPMSSLQMTIREVEFDRLHKSKDYSVRNSDIVRASEMILVVPPAPVPSEDLTTMLNVGNGGTWQTARKARMAAKPIVVFWPSGKVIIWMVGTGKKQIWSPK